MYVGIDPSLNSSGVVFIDATGGVIYSGAIAFKKKLHHTEKFVQITEKLGAMLMEYSDRPIEAVCIEKPFFGPNKLSAQFCMGVWGAMTVVLKRFFPKQYVEVHPNYLKKFVINRYTGTKDLMRVGVYKAWAFEDECMDVVDAYACAQFGMCVVEPSRFDSRQQAVVQDYMRLENAGFVTGDE